jgi:uncharacterized membrane protein
MMDGETEVRDYALERVIMLSDGVFAIAMTLLALELRPAESWDHTLNGLIAGIAVPFQAFFWSFFAAGSFWIAHRRLFGLYRRADSMITIVNLVLLGEIVLIPAATRLLTELHNPGEALGLYLGLFAIIGCTNAVSWLYASFFTDIVRPPRRGPAVKLSVGVIFAFVPVVMTGLGVMSAVQGLHWLPVLIPVVLLGVSGMRRLAGAIDQRYFGRWTGGAPGVALPAQPVAGQVDTKPG